MTLYSVRTLYRQKASGFVAHNGLELNFLDGRRLVFHNSPQTGPVLANFEEFAENQPVSVKAEYRQNLNLIWQRVNNLLSMRRTYHAITFNCEHVVQLVINGSAESAQVKASTAGGLIFGCITLLCGGNLKQAAYATALGVGGGLLLEKTHQLRSSVIEEPHLLV